jgi:gliding motility-associated-like protein
LCYGNNTGSIILNVSGGTTPYNFNWSNSSFSDNISNVTSGQYTVLITDNNGCTLQESFNINQPSAPLQISSTSVPVSCTGNSNGSIDASVSGGTPGYNYLWSNGATTATANNLQAGLYTLTVTDANGCSSILNVTLQEPPVSLVVTGNTTPANCITGVLGNIVIAPSGGTQPYSFQWDNGSTSQNLSNVLPGSYFVTVTDINGCTTGQEYLVADISSLDIQANGNTTICVGNLITISAQLSQNITAGLQWYYNGTPLTGATTSSFQTPVAGTYTLVASTVCGAYTSNAIEVIVRSLNSVMISSDAIICPGESVQLQVGGGVEYDWSPGRNLSDSTSANPIASPTVTTAYTVVVKDDFGCSATANVTVNVVCDTLDIPNGFSPNGDGTNDTFVIDGLSKYPENLLWIYNRWGNLVYKQHNYANTWDGRSNVNGVVFGQELPNGTYYYLLDLKLNQKPFNGFVVIRR